MTDPEMRRYPSTSREIHSGSGAKSLKRASDAVPFHPWGAYATALTRAGAGAAGRARRARRHHDWRHRRRHDTKPKTVSRFDIAMKNCLDTAPASRTTMEEALVVTLTGFPVHHPA